MQSQMALAYAAVESKDWDAAASHAEAALAVGDRAAPALLAVIHYRRGNPAAALRLLENLHATGEITADGMALLIRLHLLTGTPRKGWDLLLQCSYHNVFGPSLYSLPRWEGQSLRNKTVAVWGGGLGDEIFFSRYIPHLVKTGARVVINVRRPLVDLFQSIPGVAKVLPYGEPVEDAEFQFNTAELPARFGAMEEDPDYGPNPYLRVIPLELSEVPAGYLRVGLVWAADSRHLEADDRSCSLAEMSPLAAVSGVHFFNLQVGRQSVQADPPPAGMTLWPLSIGLPSFGEQAGQMMALDLIITVDTATANLAGALGLPVWVAVPQNPDWRWCRQGHRTPWYPTARVFRRTTSVGWRKLFARMAQELAAGRVKQRNSSR